MDNPIFRKANNSEIDEILSLYKSVIGTPFCTWNDEYPGLLEIKEDLNYENLFVLETDGIVIGAISIVPKNELDKIECWSLTESAGEFARVVVHKDYRGQNLAEYLVSNVLDVMKKRGFKTVHISVAVQNIPAKKTYDKLGFSTVGESFLWNHRYYLCEVNL